MMLAAAESHPIQDFRTGSINAALVRPTRVGVPAFHSIAGSTSVRKARPSSLERESAADVRERRSSRYVILIAGTAATPARAEAPVVGWKLGRCQR
jgi:hypothetical protein